MCLKVSEKPATNTINWIQHTITDSAPGLAWNGCLITTGIELELISYVDMYLMIEK